ncbi:hypothetical protein AAF712_013688 [Marasmius tenuissimus]|uniref:Uncharacterized protein n=1 Tax=Marasmius tenuissimus TaxID=585030 RepID=A0ABR2ZDY9_9AGAR
MDKYAKATAKRKERLNSTKSAKKRKEKAKNATKKFKIGIPVPNVSHYTQVHAQKKKGGHLAARLRRNPEKLSKNISQELRHHLARAKAYIPRFQVPYTMEELKKEAGNMNEFERLSAIVNRMEKPEYPVQATSGIWVTKDGTHAMTYLSHRYASQEKAPEDPLPLNRQEDRHRLVDAVQNALAEKQKMYYDGFPEEVIKRYAESAQVLCAFNRPKPDHTSERHGVQGSSGEATNTFPLSNEMDNWTSHPKEARARRSKEPTPTPVYSPDNGKTGEEGAGVHHFVEGWPQRGHPDEGLHRSSSFAGSSQAEMAAEHFYDTNECLEECVEATIEVFHEEQHKVFSKARGAARVVGNEGGGCFIGRAIVYKLPLYLHCDVGDEGVSVSFPAGRFTGGYLIIPQFGVKLWYRPGDILLLYANYIWHTIDEWKSTKMTRSHTTTPGRIGTVFFFPSKSLDYLEDKEAGWGKDTMYGRLPSSKAHRHV